MLKEAFELFAQLPAGNRAAILAILALHIMALLLVANAAARFIAPRIAQPTLPPAHPPTAATVELYDMGGGYWSASAYITQRGQARSLKDFIGGASNCKSAGAALHAIATMIGDWEQQHERRRPQ